MTVNWRGVYPAACTQFKSDQSLDLPATLKHLDAMIDAGIHGLVMLGTVGENNSLDPDEKIEVLTQTVKHVNKRVPVITGVSEFTTPQAIRFAARAEKAGVDGLMVLPAMVYPADPREAVVHFQTVARGTPLPVMIYNNPVSYKVDLQPESFKQLVDIDNIVAIKESSEDPRRITHIRNHVGDRFTLFCGVDDLVMESFILGAEGWISGLVNAFPAENRLLWDLLTAGKFDEARRVYQWYTPLLQLDTLPKLVQYIKLASQECGFGTELTRAPRLPLVGEERERILKLIRDGIKTRPATKR
ncbi:MAG: dihydrodipicolinate synthase family protein [Tepidisphaeraceae bacterium]